MPDAISRFTCFSETRSASAASASVYINGGMVRSSPATSAASMVWISSTCSSSVGRGSGSDLTAVDSEPLREIEVPYSVVSKGAHS